MSQLFGLYTHVQRARDTIGTALRVDHQTTPHPLTDQEREFLRRAQDLVGSVYSSIGDRME